MRHFQINMYLLSKGQFLCEFQPFDFTWLAKDSGLDCGLDYKLDSYLLRVALRVDQ